MGLGGEKIRKNHAPGGVKDAARLVHLNHSEDIFGRMERGVRGRG